MPVAGIARTLATLPLVVDAGLGEVVLMDLDVLLAALILAVLPAVVGRQRRAPSHDPGRAGGDRDPIEEKRRHQSPVQWDSEGTSPVAVALNRWRAGMHEFWNQQLHLHQLYLSRLDVSGGDALDALAQRKRSVSAPE